jgi:hypothetical protein
VVTFDGAPETYLDDLLPKWDFRERHGRVTAAPAKDVYAAIGAVTLAEMPLVRVLFEVRSLPARLGGGRRLPSRRGEPLLAQMLDFGFTVLAEKPGVEIVFGGVARMWKRGGGLVPVGGAEEFRTFHRAGYVKVAINFVIRAHAGLTSIDTETRVLATDAASRRGFRRYWLVIRPGSGAIRRTWLRAIARRAERSVPAPR